MLAPSIHLLFWLFSCMLFQGTTVSTNSSVHAVTGQLQITTHGPGVQNQTAESSGKSTTAATLNLTSVGETTSAKSSSVATMPLDLTTQSETSSRRSTTATSAEDHETKTSESPMTAAAQGTSKPVTPTLKPSDNFPVTTPIDDKSPLTVAAFGVISFIVILIVVVIILVSVVSLRFKCNRSKDSEDKQKPGMSMVSEGCSAGPSQKDNSITLISMKNINMNNSLSYPPSEKVL